LRACARALLLRLLLLRAQGEAHTVGDGGGDEHVVMAGWLAGWLAG
jgi:hypothetical protein